MTLQDRFFAKVEVGHDCHTWTAYRNAKGYGRFNLDGDIKFAHRVAWRIAHGVVPSGLCVLHTCDNPPCVNPAHLFLGTNADNVADRESKGRNSDKRGERNGNAKLTERDVREIRDLRGHLTQREVAELYGLAHKAVVSAIQLNKSWEA